MEIREMQMFDIEARKAEIETMLNNEDADLDALNNEVDELNARAAEIKAECEKRDALLSAIAENREGVVITEMKEEKSMSKTIDEIRNSPEYIAAYARYLKTENDKECRALLTQNAPADGQLPVPTFVYDEIKTAWEADDLLPLIRQVSYNGNLKVGFEISGSDAGIHQEGADAPTEETLTLGVVTLVPGTIKKWITISDEAIDLGGEALIRYIYAELAHKIAAYLKSAIIAAIDAAPATSSATAAGVPVLKQDMALSTPIEAMALLAGGARDLTFVMNRSTEAALKTLAIQANYPVDIFEGRRVVYDDKMTAYADAAEDDTYIIVGDFGNGALINHPNGTDIRIKYDDLSLAESDLVKIVGRMYVAFGIVNQNHFVKVTKGA